LFEKFKCILHKHNYIIKKENTLTDYDSKTVYYEKFKDFIREKHKVNNLVSIFYQNKLFRKLKFRTHIYLRKSEDKFLNNIEKTYGKKEDITIIVNRRGRGSLITFKSMGKADPKGAFNEP